VLVAIQAAKKAEVVESLESQLAESHQHLSESAVDVTKLQQRVDDLTLQLTTLRVELEQRERNVRAKICHLSLSQVL